MSGTDFLGEEFAADADPDTWVEAALISGIEAGASSATLSRRRRIEQYFELKHLREQLADFDFCEPSFDAER